MLAIVHEVPQQAAAAIAGLAAFMSTADPWVLLAIFVFLAMALWIIRDKTRSAHSDRESALRSLRGDAKNRDQNAADQALREIFRCGKKERDVELSLQFLRLLALVVAIAILAGLAAFLIVNST